MKVEIGLIIIENSYGDFYIPQTVTSRTAKTFATDHFNKRATPGSQFRVFDAEKLAKIEAMVQAERKIARERSELFNTLEKLEM